MERDIQDRARRGANVDPENTYTSQNGEFPMREPRAEERAAETENKPETREGRAGDADNRIEKRADLSHQRGGRDNREGRDPAIREEKQVVADSHGQRPDEGLGQKYVDTRDSSDADRHA